jgi:hypothetical protein
LPPRTSWISLKGELASIADIFSALLRVGLLQCPPDIVLDMTRCATSFKYDDTGPSSCQAARLLWTVSWICWNIVTIEFLRLEVAKWPSCFSTLRLWLLKNIELMLWSGAPRPGGFALNNFSPSTFNVKIRLEAWRFARLIAFSKFSISRAEACYWYYVFGKLRRLLHHKSIGGTEGITTCLVTLSPWLPCLSKIHLKILPRP